MSLVLGSLVTLVVAVAVRTVLVVLEAEQTELVAVAQLALVAVRQVVHLVDLHYPDSFYSPLIPLLLLV